MMNFIEIVLCRFESCFSRKAAFRWFVTITIGLMLRSDKLGLTSVIRDLALSPGSYDSMLHLFRASSWSLENIRRCWFSAVMDYAPLYRKGGFHVLVGDGIKQPKEGRRMPGVKKLFQESENSAKPEYIHGHMFGGLGILASTSLALDPLSVIRLYSYRFRIECTFRELKQQVGAFCYHFWSKHMPKLSYYQKKEEPSPLERVENEKSYRKVLETVRAVEMHMALSCIAMGILQSVSICFAGEFRPGRYATRGRLPGGGCQKPLSCTICGNIFSAF